jgi:hypothetical protein
MNKADVPTPPQGARGLLPRRIPKGGKPFYDRTEATRKSVKPSNKFQLICWLFLGSSGHKKYSLNDGFNLLFRTMPGKQSSHFRFLRREI